MSLLVALLVTVSTLFPYTGGGGPSRVVQPADTVLGGPGFVVQPNDTVLGGPG